MDNFAGEQGISHFQVFANLCEVGRPDKIETTNHGRDQEKGHPVLHMPTLESGMETSKLFKNLRLRPFQAISVSGFQAKKCGEVLNIT